MKVPGTGYGQLVINYIGCFICLKALEFRKHSGDGVRLPYQYRTEENISLLTCCKWCQDDSICLSVNYGSDTLTCELNTEGGFHNIVQNENGWEVYSVIKDCGTAAPTTGYIISGDTTYGGKPTIECDATNGYSGVPDPYINCRSEGTWSTFSGCDTYWLLVFRAVAGMGMPGNAWTKGTESDENCKYSDYMSCSYYRNPIVDSWTSITHKKVKYSLYQDGQQVAHILFDGVGSVTLEDWYSSERVLSSSWPSFSSSSFLDFRVFDSKSRAFCSTTHLGEGCHENAGYSITVVGNVCCGCNFDAQTTYPQFLFSTTSTTSLYESEEMGHAEYMTINIET